MSRAPVAFPVRQHPRASLAFERQYGDLPTARIVGPLREQPDRSAHNFQRDLLQVEAAAREGRSVATDRNHYACMVDAWLGYALVLPVLVEADEAAFGARQETRDHAIAQLRPKLIMQANTPLTQRLAAEAGLEAMSELLKPLAGALSKENVTVKVAYAVPQQ